MHDLHQLEHNSTGAPHWLRQGRRHNSVVGLSWENDTTTGCLLLLPVGQDHTQQHLPSSQHWKFYLGEAGDINSHGFTNNRTIQTANYTVSEERVFTVSCPHPNSMALSACAQNVFAGSTVPITHLALQRQQATLVFCSRLHLHGEQRSPRWWQP